MIAPKDQVVCEDAIYAKQGETSNYPHVVHMIFWVIHTRAEVINMLSTAERILIHNAGFS